MGLGLHCFGQTLNFQATNPEVLDYVSSLDHLFSIPLVITECDEDGPRLSIMEGSPPSLAFEAVDRSLTFRVEWSLIDRSHAIQRLLGQLLSLSCVDAGTFILHAAAISQADEAYLLIGGIGAGKTGLSVALSSYLGFRWISNDHAGLSVRDDRIMLCEGYDLIDFRKLSFPQIATFLSPDTSDRVRSRFPTDATPWTKTDPPFRAEELALPLGSVPCPVKALFFPLVGLTSYECFQPMQRSMATAALLSMLTRPLRGTEAFIMDNSGRAICPSVGIEPTEGWTETYDFVNSLVSQCSAYTVHGALESAAQFIALQVSESRPKTL